MPFLINGFCRVTRFRIQKAPKYHARSIALLRTNHAALPDKAAFDSILEAAGCLAELRA
jgi:hypothetical protein